MAVDPLNFNPIVEMMKQHTAQSEAGSAPQVPVIAEGPQDSKPLLTVGDDGKVRKTCLYGRGRYGRDYYH